MEYKNQVSVDFHLFDQTTSFRKQILSFFKYELAVFDMKIAPDLETIQSNSSPIPITSIDITNRYQPKDLFYRVVDNFNGNE